MDWWLAYFFLGAIFSLFSPLVPDLFVLFSLILLSIVFFSYPFILNKRNNTIKPLRLSSGLLFGATWMLFNALNLQQLWQENNLDIIDLSSKPQWIQGEVLSLHLPSLETSTLLNNNIPTTSRLRFNINVTHINNQRLTKEVQLRLSWKNPSLSLHQGQTARLKVKFKPAHGLANLGSFSYQTWLNSKKISATGYVIKHKKNKLLLSKGTLRQQIYTHYQEILPNHSLAPLLLALGFGSRSELTPELWHILQATGTGHLIAISGLHIGLVATGTYLVFMFLFRVLPLSFFANSHKIQTVNSRYFAIGLSMVAALSYGYLAGFSLTTVRALLMLSLYWCIRLLGIKISKKRWLLLTLFIITLTVPFSLFTASFWLSVYAVIIIFITLWRFQSSLSSGNRFWRFIKGLVIIQLSLTLMLLPISAIFFQQISVVSLFANIIAVPWMSFIGIPLCLLSVLLMPISESLTQFIIVLCLESIQLIWQYLTYLSTKSWAIITLSSLSVQLIVLAGLLSVYFVFYKAKLMINAKSIIAVLFWSTLLFIILKQGEQLSNKDNDWQLVIFDVGQGLSILIQKNNRAILYDTGAAYESGFNMVDAVVLPYLQYRGIQHLDKVIISHGDNDHAGGLATLQESIEIKALIYNVSKTKDNIEKAQPCLQGGVFNWQGITFEFLWPDHVVSKENDDSCVLLISDKYNKVLLTGDISKKVESKLIEQYPSLQANILVVPHHGSKTSSSEAFISHVTPGLALVSAGYLNRWRMPVSEVVKRYQLHNIPLINSANSGQIIINLSENGIAQMTYREHLWPFWFANSL